MSLDFKKNIAITFFYLRLVSILPNTNHRKEKIIKMLKEDGSAKVAELARIFKVTEVTIRQDLEKLETEGLIIREHGGASLTNMADQVQSFSLANQDNLDKTKN